MPADLTDQLLERLVVLTLGSEGRGGRWAFAIRLVSDPVMQDAHAQFMDIDEPTDIMTFPYDRDDLDEPYEGGGDLLISSERAADHAAEVPWQWADELAFLVIHGVLHVLGWDDTTADHRERMLRRQHDILTEFQRA